MAAAAARMSIPSRLDRRNTTCPAPLPSSPAFSTFSTTACVVTESMPMRSSTERSIDGVVWVRASSTTGSITWWHSSQNLALRASSSRSASSERNFSKRSIRSCSSVFIIVLPVHSPPATPGTSDRTCSSVVLASAARNSTSSLLHRSGDSTLAACLM